MSSPQNVHHCCATIIIASAVAHTPPQLGLSLTIPLTPQLRPPFHVPRGYMHGLLPGPPMVPYIGCRRWHARGKGALDRFALEVEQR